jgi:hypothetical protein
MSHFFTLYQDSTKAENPRFQASKNGASAHSSAEKLTQKTSEKIAQRETKRIKMYLERSTQPNNTRKNKKKRKEGIEKACHHRHSWVQIADLKLN